MAACDDRKYQDKTCSKVGGKYTVKVLYSSV
jgi:hypothetical protein